MEGGDVPRMTKAYGSALSGNWKGMRDFYEQESFGHMHSPITLSDDTALHISVYSQKEQPLKDLLENLDIVTDFFMPGIEVIMKKNEYGNTVLHEATITGNLEAVKLLVEGHPGLVSIQNNFGETPLFTAAAFGELEIVQYLIEARPELIIKHDDKSRQLLKVHRKREKIDGASILQVAIQAQDFVTAFHLLQRDESLQHIKDKSGITALELLASMPSAFKSGSEPMGVFESLFYYCLPADSIVEHKTPLGYERKREDLESSRLVRGLRGKLNSLNVPKASQMARTLSTCIFLPLAWLVKGKRIWEQKRKHVYALGLARILIKEDVTWDEVHQYHRNKTSEQIASTASQNGAGGAPVDNGRNITSEQPPNEEITEETSEAAVNSSGAAQGADQIPVLQEGASNKGKEKHEGEDALFKAARNGIEEIVFEILAEHPEAVWQFNKMGQSILDVAVIHRQKKIFNFVKQLKTPLHRLKRLIDKEGNTLLHHVANTEHYSGGTRPGPALQLQEELLWFERVQNIVPPRYVMHPNNKHKTAKEHFKETHEVQLQKAQKWIKGTAQSCSTVAALVATVVFAAAYTVPGGANERGIPNFIHSPYFLIFTVSDVVSLASSLTSLVVFLSTLTSPFEIDDFRRSLPRRLMLGFTLLFFSVITTMLAFGSTILILIQSDRKLNTFLISVAAFLPVFVFAMMQFRMYIALLGSSRKIIPKKIRKAFSLGWEKKLNRRFSTQ